MQQPTRYRQPWAPAVPSTLGMSRSSMNSMIQSPMSGGMKSEHDGSDHGIEIRTNPATPVKGEDNSASPGHASSRDD